MSLLTLAEEIAALREGGRRLATYVREVGATIKPGITTRELNDHFERLVRAGNDEPSFLNYAPRGAKRPFPAAICISVNDEVVHGIPTENSRVIMDGDIVTLDGGVTHQGLITDHAVSFIAGIPDEEAVALLQTTERGLLAGVAAAKIGNHVGDISAAVEAVGVEEGYGIVYELGGHGVGYHVDEEPYIPNVGCSLSRCSVPNLNTFCFKNSFSIPPQLSYISHFSPLSVILISRLSVSMFLT